MSGPMQPAVNNIMRMPLGQTKKPMGDSRPPGVLPPGQSNEPLQRSEAARRIIAARRLGIDPSQLEQAPGYRPGKGNRAPVPQAPQRAAPPPQPQPAPAEAAPVQSPVPLPRPRPQPENTNFIRQALEMQARNEAQRQAVAPSGPIPAKEFARQAAEMQARNRPGAPAPQPQPGAPVDPEKFKAQAGAMQDKNEGSAFLRQVQEMQKRNDQRYAPGYADNYGRGAAPISPGAQAQVREATPDEVQAAQKNEMAKKIAAQRSGGEQPAAPAARGGALPPAPSVAPSPASPPPPDVIRPITGPTAEYIKRDPAAEKERGKKDKPQKSTYKESAVPNQRYYDILKVPRGDNRLASQAVTKLRAKVEAGYVPTMEEDALLAAENEAYPLKMDPGSVKARFEKYESGEVGGKSETGRPKFEQGDQRPPERVSVIVPQAGQTIAAYVPPVKGAPRPTVDPAEVVAQRAIEQAGSPLVKRAPTQEDINQNPKAYKSKADVDTDTAVQDTEDED